MKALLLAAGRGTRISRYLSGDPKCTVNIGGDRLITYTVKKLKEKGVDRIGIALGYRADVIRSVLAGTDVRFFTNPFYDVTNSIASAWFAGEFLEGQEDTLIMNADVYLEDSLFDQILESSASPVMFADSTRKEEGDYKFKYENNLLQKYGKELTGEDISGEYVGIGRFAGSFMPVFLQKMKEMIDTQQHGVWWENVLYSMVGTEPVYVEEVNGRFWAEVDYIEDYQRILAHRGYSMRMDNGHIVLPESTNG